MPYGVNGKETAYEFLVRTIKDAGDDCLEWPYSKTNGYGQCGVSASKFPHFVRTPDRVHIVAYSLDRGRRPADGMQVRHLCGNPSCYNPKHLKMGTVQENADDRRLHGTAISHDVLDRIERLYFRQYTLAQIGEMVGHTCAVNYVDRGDYRCDDCVYQASRCKKTRKRFDACNSKQEAIALIGEVRAERKARFSEILSKDWPRNKKMAFMRESYFTLEFIGHYFGITRERVRQLTCPKAIKYYAYESKDWPPITIFGKSINKHELANRLGLSLPTVKVTFAKRVFPASWYLVVKQYADELGLDCPDEFFAFKKFSEVSA